MTGKERADLGFGAAVEGLNLEEWTPTKKTSNDRPPKEVTEKIAKDAGFVSREPKVVQEQKASPVTKPTTKAAQKGRGGEQFRHVTGRNVQMNLKATNEAIDEFKTICQQQGWVQGEGLEISVMLMKEAIAAGRFPKK